MSAQLKSSIKYPGSLVRPRFEPGQLLIDEDLTAIVDHTRDLSRLLFRSLFGCGVICGFRVTWKIECGNLTVTVEPGVALDCRGDPIEMCQSQVLNWICVEQVNKPLWVAIRRSPRDHNCAPRDVACPTDDDRNPYKHTRSKDCFELTLTDKPPEHACGCDPVVTAGAAQPDHATPGAAAAPATPPTEAAAQPATDATIAAGGVIDRGNAEIADPQRCHIPHYCGICSCSCDCGDGWVVLARVSVAVDREKKTIASVDHNVRRFIRPYLIPDPLRNEDAAKQCRELLKTK